MLNHKIILFVLTILISITHVFASSPQKSCDSQCSKSNLSKDKKCVMIGKNKLYYRTLGDGQPTIIFSSGTGFAADAWFDSGIATKLSVKNKVFAYDRAFTFNSCQNPKNTSPITAQDVVNQLHQLLKQEKISPPYILVGHSFGGLYMLLYAREFPNDVAGLLLMDASYGAPTPLPKEAVSILNKLGDPQNPKPSDPLYNEIIGQKISYHQLNNAPVLNKKIPLVTMYATKHCLPKQWTKKLMCMTEKQEKSHLEKQIAIFKYRKFKDYIYQAIKIN